MSNAAATLNCDQHGDEVTDGDCDDVDDVEATGATAPSAMEAMVFQVPQVSFLCSIVHAPLR